MAPSALLVSRSLRFALLLLPFATPVAGFSSLKSRSREHPKQQHLFNRQSCGNVCCDASPRSLSEESEESVSDRNIARRQFIASALTSSLAFSVGRFGAAANAEETRPVSGAEITDKIFIEFKGLGGGPDSSNRIVIGLFGKDAPQPVSVLKQLVTKGGYKSKCKPLDTSRLLQKDQLEANKVYNGCLENEDTVGVNYDFSLVWRIIPDQRIDVGAVSGKYIARENPNFEDTKSGLTHDMPGVVSVRRGDDGGYGFTIYPGKGNDEGASFLNEDNVVVGRVIEGFDVVEQLNAIPVVKSAGINYMALTGGTTAKNAPTRACRYGGPMYCNENKPLKKVMIEKSGFL